MDFLTVFLLAIALSADAFAVSVTNGIYDSTVTKRDALITGFTFGSFQALMPILGFLLGTTFSDFVSRYQHWIAVILLGTIGINMMVEAVNDWKKPEDTLSVTNIFTAKNLVIQGIATSIDALAAGVSLAVLNINIITSALMIGLITFICCTFGVYIGKKFGSLLGLRARFIGGLVIIAIGIKIFIENQFI
ncbi:MAG TPA: manganese efflux pump MntP family protein [Mobilitalea sp.]|nr:manganese efflux pump MntP family protein [Mobilitalea sp.]